MGWTITLESDEPLGRQIVTMLDVAVRGVGDHWDNVIIPDMGYVVVENTPVTIRPSQSTTSIPPMIGDMPRPPLKQ
jgi:hypothetical protein